MKNKFARTLFWVTAGIVLLTPPAAYSQDKKPVRFFFETGYYEPSLKTLRHVLRDKKFGIEQDPNFLLPGNVIQGSQNQYDRNIETRGFSGRFSYGMGVEWNAYRKHSLLLSVSVWQDSISASDTFPVPLINFDNPFDAPRTSRYDLEITQLWLGWKYDIIPVGKRGNLYTNIELFGVALAYLTQDVLLKVNAPSFGQSFASVSSTESFGLGYTSRFSVGGEYFLTEWASISATGGFIVGRAAKLKVKRYFPSSFTPEIVLPDDAANINRTVPDPPSKGDVIVFGEDDSSNTSRELKTPATLPLELDGTYMNFALRFHF